MLVFSYRLNAGEFPITADSTVIGQNFGYTSGTPETEMTDTGNLDFVFETTIFSKNLELFDLHPYEGQTYFGTLMPLRFRYRPHEQVTIEAGALLGYNFGDNNELEEIEPIIRMVYEPVRNAFFIAGTILRTHAMHDAVFDDAIAFKENAEQGLQFRMDLRDFKEDLWINWRLSETSRRSEKFDIGNVTQLRFGGLWIDAQFLWRHTGGQQNTENTVEHNMSYLFGGSYGFHPGAKVRALGMLEEIRLVGSYIYDKDTPDDESDLDESTGSGYEARITFDIKPKKNIRVHLFGSYFSGDSLIARAGDPLYSFEDYAQAGTNIGFALPAGLRLEFGFAGQFVEDKFAHTGQIHISWGKGVTLFEGI
jgi:hypothetical protein